MTRLGDPGENPGAAKSSTMKGPAGLASNFDERRSRTAKRTRPGYPYLLRSRGEITIVCNRGDYGRPGGRHIRRVTRRVTPSSDVTHQGKDIANWGRARTAGG